MDLRNGNIILQNPRDAVEVLEVVDGTGGFLLDIARRADLQVEFPAELTPSETAGVKRALDTQVDLVSSQGPLKRRAEARRATKMLSTIASMGLRASAKLGATDELARQLVEEIRRSEASASDEAQPPISE
jgi:hypothetical protein